QDWRGADGPDERPPVRTQERQRLAARDEIEAREHAQHEELALGEVDDAHDAEDEPEADAHETVDAADRDARGDRVQNIFDQDFKVHRACAVLPFTGPGEMARAELAPERSAATLARPGASLKKRAEHAPSTFDGRTVGRRRKYRGRVSDDVRERRGGHPR